MAALAGCNNSSRQEGASSERANPPPQAQRDASNSPGPMAANPAPVPAAPSASPGQGAGPGEQSPSGQSLGSKLDDASVTAKVKAALIAETGPVAAKVNVSTTDGKVTLKGAVPKDQIEHIIQIARNVDGVQEVDNQLRPGTS